MSSFYLRLQDPDAFEPTVATRGPWSNDHQHAGPPSALLARALIRAASQRGSLRLVRFLVELYRPIPIAPLRIEVAPPTRGRRVQRLEASLIVNGEVCALARGLFIREETLEISPPVQTPPPPPDNAATDAFPFFQADEGYHTAVEIRFTHGGFGQARSGAWFRQRVALVEGEETTPTERTLVAADSGNGITNVLDTRRFVFVNADLIVSFSRPPVGEWIHLSAETEPDAGGSGQSFTRLSDQRGAFGRGAQSLFLDAVVPD